MSSLSSSQCTPDYSTLRQNRLCSQAAFIHFYLEAIWNAVSLLPAAKVTSSYSTVDDLSLMSVSVHLHFPFPQNILEKFICSSGWLGDLPFFFSALGISRHFFLNAAFLETVMFYFSLFAFPCSTSSSLSSCHVLPKAEVSQLEKGRKEQLWSSVWMSHLQRSWG